MARTQLRTNLDPLLRRACPKHNHRRHRPTNVHIRLKALGRLLDNVGVRRLLQRCLELALASSGFLPLSLRLVSNNLLALLLVMAHVPRSLSPSSLTSIPHLLSRRQNASPVIHDTLPTPAINDHPLRLHIHKYSLHSFPCLLAPNEPAHHSFFRLVP